MSSQKIKRLIEQLELLLNPFDTCDLEWDGLTRVLSTILTRQHILHIPTLGKSRMLEPVKKSFTTGLNFQTD